MDEWEWEYSTLDLKEIRQMLWEVDILRDFDEKLQGARKQIEKAEAVTKASLKKRVCIHNLGSDTDTWNWLKFVGSQS